MEGIDDHFSHDSSNDLEKKIQSLKRSNDGEFREKWSMVLIRDSIPHNECSVFPPKNHENLHLPSHENEEQEDPSSPFLFSSSLSASSSSLSSSFSPSETDSSDLEPLTPLNTQVQKPHMASGLMGFGLDMLLSKLFGFASFFVCNGGMRWRISSFSSGAGIFAVVVMLWSWYMRVRHRRVRDNLKLIIREKEEVSIFVSKRCLI